MNIKTLVNKSVAWRKHKNNSKLFRLQNLATIMIGLTISVTVMVTGIDQRGPGDDADLREEMQWVVLS